jgi:hypothetical protein
MRNKKMRAYLVDMAEFFYLADVQALASIKQIFREI